MQSKAKQSQAKLSKAKKSKAKQSKAKQGKAKQTKAKPSKAEQVDQRKGIRKISLAVVLCGSLVGWSRHHTLSCSLSVRLFTAASTPYLIYQAPASLKYLIYQAFAFLHFSFNFPGACLPYQSHNTRTSIRSLR